MVTGQTGAGLGQTALWRRTAERGSLPYPGDHAENSKSVSVFLRLCQFPDSPALLTKRCLEQSDNTQKNSDNNYDTDDSNNIKMMIKITVLKMVLLLRLLLLMMMNKMKPMAFPIFGTKEAMHILV